MENAVSLMKPICKQGLHITLEKEVADIVVFSQNMVVIIHPVGWGKHVEQIILVKLMDKLKLITTSFFFFFFCEINALIPYSLA